MIFLIRYRLFLLANQKQAVYVHLKFCEELHVSFFNLI